MLKNWSLQMRMISAFLFIGLIVLIVALVGWNGNLRLSDRLNTLSTNSLPSISGLWKINEGQTQIQSAERALLNPLLSPANRMIESNRIKESWKQIEEGFKEYELAPVTARENALYKEFISLWDVWKQNHQQFMQVYEQFQKIGIIDPMILQVQLLSQGKGNTPEMTKAKTAAALLNKLNFLAANQERSSFNQATEGMHKILEVNYDLATRTQNTAGEDISQTTFWVVLGMIIGPITAIIFGIYFSITIAKPLSTKIATIVNTIASSSSEIAATIEQQELAASQQAVSVNQTTTTMDELSSSSRQSAEQAAAATQGVSQALEQVEEGSKAVEKALQEMGTLKEKVEAIAQQISHLSQQTSQIGNISSLVSELANQTNMLALNAAVEAVRAAEHGKGFAVVASEIRKLADESKKSAQKISSLVQDIQSAISSTVLVTDSGTQSVNSSLTIAEQTSAAFTAIANAIDDVFLRNQKIALNAQQQAIAIQQVVVAMNALNQVAAQTASGISKTKLETQRLNQVVQNLKAIA
ncbi:chemotaxis protein [[Phormidium ambiguum] IAM M-71]|uniref:Chemotaxis protein n=1 Tax=[Phormidium ambiguum] IAM M-71 TaxID=454136 RepID=A0A1U7IU82_9CYAN|nr:methyl-accepting chemotaxis protein [Phormidium ambiguum]OKH41032.1 chemotaxis protein [Phormidium ambiguum IAM M-71]